MNDMRIGYVVKRYPRYSETFILNEILAHENAGLEIDIFSLRPTVDTHFQDLLAYVKSPVTYLDGNETIKSVDFWAAIDKASRTFPGLWANLSKAQGEEHRDVYQAILLALLIKEKGITHLHAHFATSSTAVARMAANFAGITYSFTAHAKDIFHEDVQHEDLHRRIDEAAAVVTVSDYHVRFLEGVCNKQFAQLRRIYNGLNLDRFTYQQPNETSELILGVGRLVEKKGFHLLVEACACLKERGVNYQCQIVGTGPLEESLRAHIAAHHVEDRVELLGPLPQSEIIAKLRDVAVMAAPCVIGEDGNQDGLPTVLLESMALGAPCISTDVTGIPEAIIHEETGLLVEKNNATELAAALERLLIQRDLRQTLSQRARHLIEERFDIGKNAAQLRQVFQDIHTSAGTPVRKEVVKCA